MWQRRASSRRTAARPPASETPEIQGLAEKSLDRITEGTTTDQLLQEWNCR